MQFLRFLISRCLIAVALVSFSLAVWELLPTLPQLLFSLSLKIGLGIP